MRDSRYRCEDAARPEGANSSFDRPVAAGVRVPLALALAADEHVAGTLGIRVVLHEAEHHAVRPPHWRARTAASVASPSCLADVRSRRCLRPVAGHRSAVAQAAGVQASTCRSARRAGRGRRTAPAPARRRRSPPEGQLSATARSVRRPRRAGSAPRLALPTGANRGTAGTRCGAARWRTSTRRRTYRASSTRRRTSPGTGPRPRARPASGGRAGGRRRRNALGSGTRTPRRRPTSPARSAAVRPTV